MRREWNFGQSLLAMMRIGNLPFHVLEESMGEMTEVTGATLIDRADPSALRPFTREIFGSSRHLPISPEDRIYLDVYRHGDDTRFALIFQDAWHKIPTTDRAKMTDYWLNHERILGVLGICIKMENLWSMRSNQTLGVCQLLGTSLNFYSPVVDRLPPKHVAALVAHELAHVYQASARTLTATENPLGIEKNLLESLAKDCDREVEEMEAKLRHASDPVEHDANRIAKRWGFNAPAMNRWVQKRIDWDMLPSPIY